MSTLKMFWEDHPEYTDAKEPTLAWYRHALSADWSTPTDVKQDFRIASILKDGRVEVSSDQVADPVAVRYGWAENPVVNMFNNTGLPLTPFRTDEWPGITVDVK